jgi:O-antigen/teichoic acid export membrane protein
MGLQRQVRLNVTKGVMGTVQAVGAVLVLWLVSPSVLAYFAWQAFTSLVLTLALARGLWRSLSVKRGAATFDAALLQKNWHFAAGMTGIAILTTILTQLDKLVLTKLLPLEAFGYYAIAFNVANGALMLVHPIFLAVFPRLAQLATGEDEAAVAGLYHSASRLVSVAVLPVATTLIVFSREALELWLHSASTAERASPLLTALMVGSALNAIVTLPYALQLAYGWTRLSIVKNVIAVLVSVPLLFWLISLHGAMGAALVWIGINAGYFLFEVPYMHRRLLRGEMRRWYVHDNLLPLSILGATCLVSRTLFPRGTGALTELSWIAVTWAIGTAAVAAAYGMLSPSRIRTYLLEVTGR